MTQVDEFDEFDALVSSLPQHYWHFAASVSWVLYSVLAWLGFVCYSLVASVVFQIEWVVDLKKGFLVRLTTGQYINIALTTGQYGIYCPVGGFDPPTQWATKIIMSWRHNDNILSGTPVLVFFTQCSCLKRRDGRTRTNGETFSEKHGAIKYRKLSDLKLPRALKVKSDDRLYPVEIVDREDHRVKIHYLGYDSSYDEWREQDDVVPLTSPAIAENSQILLYSIFSLCWVGN